MSFWEARERRVRNDMARLRRLCEGNPGRLRNLEAAPVSGSEVTRLRVEAAAKTAARGTGRASVEIRELSVELLLELPRNYPYERPGLMIASDERLFLGGVAQVPLEGRWIGPVCLFREYDLHRHTTIQHVVGACDILRGRALASVRDCLNAEAARYWLERKDELPWDECLVLPRDAEWTPRPEPEFELQEAPL